MSASYRNMVVLLAASLVAASASGCRRTVRETGSLSARVGTATLTGALVYVPSDIAREQLAQARCERATKCEQVGEGKTYLDLSDCTVRVQVELQPRLGREECPAGVDELALRDCVDTTAHGECGRDADAKRDVACAAEKLCRKPVSR